MKVVSKHHLAEHHTKVTQKTETEIHFKRFAKEILYRLREKMSRFHDFNFKMYPAYSHLTLTQKFISIYRQKQSYPEARMICTYQISILSTTVIAWQTSRPLGLKGGICHFVKWKIPPFNPKAAKYTSIHFSPGDHRQRPQLNDAI